MKIKKCLMLETEDKKKFFTPEKNYNTLLEFANRFNCEISTVKLEEGVILDLIPLASAISTKETCSDSKYELLEKKFYKPKRTYKKNS